MVTLSDLVRTVSGFPIDLDAVVALLELADEVLVDGRDCRRALTDEEIRALGFIPK